MNVHLHHAISDLTGVSGLAITDAILDGERDPARLAALAHPRIKASRATLIKALEGDWRDEHVFTLRHARQTYAHYQQLISECDQELEARIRAFEQTQEPPAASATDQQPPQSPETRPEAPAPTGPACTMQAHLTRLFGTDLTLIPGIGEATALVLFSELGPDLTRFPSASQFASWLNLCPQNKITGGKVIQLSDWARRQPRGAGPAHGNPDPCTAATPRWVTSSAASVPGSAPRRRLPTPPTRWAPIIYHLVTRHVLYDDNVLLQQQRQDRKRHERRLRNSSPRSWLQARSGGCLNALFLRSSPTGPGRTGVGMGETGAQGYTEGSLRGSAK